MTIINTTVNTVATTINSVTGTVEVSSPGPQGPSSPKTLTVLEPFSGDNYTLFYTVAPKSIGTIAAGITGSGSPSVTFALRQATNRSAAGTLVVPSTVISNIAAATMVTPGDPDILASSFLWLEILGTSGVVNEFHLTLEF